MLFQSLTKCLLPLMEPGVEDFLRRRREAYGKTSGPVHVPPPLPPISSGDDAASAAAARLAAATHGQYNAQAAWGASLAVCAQRSRGGGRGSSDLAVGAAADWVAGGISEANEWFGGTLDATGRFVRGGAKPATAGGAAAAVAAAAPTAGEQGVSHARIARSVALGVAVAAACVAVLRAQRR